MIPVQYKIMAVALLLIAVAFGGYRAGVKIERADWQRQEITRQQDEKDAILDRIADNDRKQRDNDAKNRKVSDDYENRLAVLRKARAADRVARDAHPADGLHLPRAVCDFAAADTNTSGDERHHEAATGAIRLPITLENNLYDLADDADEIVEQARACQNWIKQHGFYGEPE